jgi:hypothetical protein
VLNKPPREIYAIKCEHTDNYDALTTLITLMATEGHPFNARIAGRFAQLTAKYINKSNDYTTYLDTGYGIPLAATKDYMPEEDITLLRNVVTNAAMHTQSAHMARLLMETAMVVGIDPKTTDRLEEAIRHPTLPKSRGRI